MNGKLKAKHIISILLILFSIGFLINFRNYNVANKIFVSCFFVITLLLLLKVFLFDQILQTRQNKAAAEKEAAAIEAIRSGIYPQNATSALLLRKGEFSSFECPTYMTISKEKLVGSVADMDGASVKFSKNILLHNGTSTSRNIYETFTDRYDGTFVVTSQRVAFLNAQCGFEIPYNELTAVYPSPHMISLQSGEAGYNVYITTSQVIAELIKKLAMQH